VHTTHTSGKEFVDKGVVYEIGRNDTIGIDNGNSSQEYQLWGAVLKQAINDLGDKDERQRAMVWFKSTRNNVGAFLWICMILTLEPRKIRKAMLV
jgi:hypothetical protein